MIQSKTRSEHRIRSTHSLLKHKHFFHIVGHFSVKFTQPCLTTLMLRLCPKLSIWHWKISGDSCMKLRLSQTQISKSSIQSSAFDMMAELCKCTANCQFYLFVASQLLSIRTRYMRFIPCIQSSQIQKDKNPPNWQCSLRRMKCSTKYNLWLRSARIRKTHIMHRGAYQFTNHSPHYNI